MQEVYWSVSLSQLLWGPINAGLGRGEVDLQCSCTGASADPVGGLEVEMVFQRCIYQSFAVAAPKEGQNLE